MEILYSFLYSHPHSSLRREELFLAGAVQAAEDLQLSQLWLVGLVFQKVLQQLKCIKVGGHYYYPYIIPRNPVH